MKLVVVLILLLLFAVVIWPGATTKIWTAVKKKITPKPEPGGIVPSETAKGKDADTEKEG